MQEIKYLPTGDLKLDPNNPRFIKDEDFEKLCDSIKKNPKYFEVRPILCTPDMVIFAGNMRWHAAKHLGKEQVPVAIMNITKAERDELMLRDNIQNGQWDWDKLANFDTDMLLQVGCSEKELTASIEGLSNQLDQEGKIKIPYQTMTFTLATQQADLVRQALEKAKKIDKKFETYGNENANSNALYLILKEWLGK